VHTPSYIKRLQLSSPRLVAEVWRPLALAPVDQDRPSAETWLDLVGASAVDAEVQRAEASPTSATQPRFCRFQPHLVL